MTEINLQTGSADPAPKKTCFRASDAPTWPPCSEQAPEESTTADSVPSGTLVALRRRRRSDERAGNRWSRELGMPPVGLPRRMWAGSKLQFHSPILAGQKLSRTTTIESITEKTGGSGSLCFVVLRHEVSADGNLATTDRHTIVYREATSVPEGSSAAPARAD